MNADIFAALNHAVEGGRLDGLPLGSLVFGRDRDLRLLREIAATGTADASAAAAAVLHFCRIPLEPSLNDELLDSAKTTTRARS